MFALKNDIPGGSAAPGSVKPLSVQLRELVTGALVSGDFLDLFGIKCGFHERTSLALRDMAFLLCSIADSNSWLVVAVLLETRMNAGFNRWKSNRFNQWLPPVFNRI